MKPPIAQLKKDEIKWLNDHNCKAHRVSYLQHYNCFLGEKPEDSPFLEKVGFLDIEATNLKADFGYVLSYAIKERGGEIIGRVLTPNEIRRFKFDEDLMKECCDDIMKFHRIIVYYGIDNRFDLPYLRTRAIKYKLDFPLYKDVYVQDAYSIVRAKLQLHRNRLETACQEFGIPSKGHRLNPDVWQKAQAGHEDSLRYIWEHNKEDVVSLELLWDRLESYVLKNRRSI